MSRFKINSNRFQGSSRERRLISECWVLLFAMSILSSFSHAMQDEKAVCEIFRNQVLNIQAIENGDLLMRYHEEYDSINLTDLNTDQEFVDPRGVLVESVGTLRFRFDTVNNNYLWIVHERYSQVNVRSDIEVDDHRQLKTRKSERLKVVIVRQQNRVEMNWWDADKPTRSTRDLDKEGFPDDLPSFRSSLYTGSFKPKPWADIVTSVDRAVSGKDFWKSNREIDGNLRIVFRSELVGHGIDCLYYDYLIDPESQMVIASEMYNADELGNNRAIGFKNKAEWTLKNDIYVPKNNRHELPRVSRIPIDTDDGSEVRKGMYWVYRDLDYTWFSLNEAVEDEWFEESTYDSLEKIKELLFVKDPKENAIKDEK